MREGGGCVCERERVSVRLIERKGKKTEGEQELNFHLAVKQIFNKLLKCWGQIKSGSGVFT